MEKISSSKIEIQSILTPKLLFLGALLCLISTTVVLFMNAFSKPGAFVRYHVDQGWGASSFTAFGFSVTFLTILVSLFQEKLKIDSKKFSVLYAMIITAASYSSSYGYPFQTAYIIAQFRANPVTITNWARVYPSWLPSEIAAKAMVTGGIAVPWADWLPAYAVSLVWVLLSFSLFASLNLIFRRQWIDIERMEFPHARVASYAIDVLSNPKGSILRLKRIMIGFIPIFIFMSNFWLGIWYPWIPSIAPTMLKAPWIGWHPGVFDIFWAAPVVWDYLPGTNGCFNTWPWFWAISFLLPLNMLISAFIFAIIGQIILPASFIWTGVWTPRPVVTPGWSSHSSWVTWMTVTQMPVFIDMGMWLALSLLPLILHGNWKYIRDTLKGTLSKDEVESGGISYRTAWALFVVSFILYLIFIMGVLQVHVTAALLMLTVWTIIGIGIVRVRGMSGVNVTTVGESYGGLHRLMWVNIPEYSSILASKVSTEATPSLFGAWYFITQTANDNQQCSYWSVGALNMEAYKLGALANVKPKDITISTFIAAIIGATISFPLLLFLTYARGVKPEGIVALWGMAAGFSNVGFGNGYGGWGTKSGDEFLAYRTEWNIYFLGGFVTMAVIVWAFLTFPWFILHPVGALIGIGHFQVYGLGFVMGVVYVIKWLILKYGGIKVYEEWVIPIMVGVVLGNAMGTLIWGIAGISVGL
jgi:hypothetical protein